MTADAAHFRHPGAPLTTPVMTAAEHDASLIGALSAPMGAGIAATEIRPYMRRVWAATYPDWDGVYWGAADGKLVPVNLREP